MIILITIALFAALSYAVSNMLSTGGNPSVVATQNQELAADEIINQARLLRQAVQALRINGCPETGISFTADGADGYEHTPAVPQTCMVFHSNGGGLSRSLRSVEGYDWKFSSNYAVTDLGSATVELFAIMRVDNPLACEALNKKLGYDDPSLTGAGAIADTFLNTTARFQGSYITTGTINEAAMDGRYAACLASAVDGNPSAFVQVLIAR